jgi:hypothetical protein
MHTTSHNHEQMDFNYYSSNTPVVIETDGRIRDSVSINESSDYGIDIDDELMEILANTPVMNGMTETPGQYYSSLEIQSIITKSYYRLEMLGCLALSIIICSDSFTFVFLTKYELESDLLLKYVLYKFVNFTAVGFITFICTTPDTYKSISLTAKHLAINCVIYEYDSIRIFKYICIHVTFGILGAIITYLIFFDLLKNFETEQIITNIFSQKRSYSYNLSYITTSILMHTMLSSGLTIFTNMTNMTNARMMAWQKSAFTCFISIVYGVVIGPIGYLWYNLSLYCVIIIIRGDFYLFNIELFLTYFITIIGIIFLYPIMAIFIKYKWRKLYRKYIEYETM